MTPRELEEYKALRETIGRRGTARVALFAAGMTAWAVLALGVWAWNPVPLATVIPLILLGSSFEAVFALHIGVERIGRYVQVFHETRDELACWETTAMAFGAPPPGTALDPLFTTWLAAAVLVNFVPVLLADPTRIEVITIGAVHLAMLARLAFARRAANRQRAGDLARFDALKRKDAHEQKREEHT